MRKLAFLMFAFSAVCHGQALSGILASSRSTTWSGAGATIPKRTVNCASIAPMGTVSVPVAPTSINSAIASCPAGEVVFLQAGNFYLNNGIDFANHSNVTLRGAGANSTFLYFNGDVSCFGLSAPICIENDNETYSGGWASYGNWTANYSQGTTAITINVVSNAFTLYPGKLIVLDQCNTGYSGNATGNGPSSDPGCHTGSTSDNGNLFNCDTVGTCNSGSPTGNYRASDTTNGGPNRAQSEVHTIQSVSPCSGSPCAGSGPGNYTVTLTEPIRLPNWASGSSPGAWWPDANVTGDGVENLSLDTFPFGTLSQNYHVNIGIIWASNSWVTGVRSIQGLIPAHIAVWTSDHVTVANNYFYLSGSLIASGYGIAETQSSDVLFQNNICQGVTSCNASDGPSTNSVYAYNFAINPAYFQANAMIGTEEPHSAGDMLTLFEGEEELQLDDDSDHGTKDMQTAFRSWYSGCATGLMQQTAQPITIHAYSRYANIIGNVLGCSTAQTGSYANFAPGGSGSNPQNPSIGPDNPIYMFGWYGNSNTNYDTLSASTSMLWANYDVKTAAVRYCGPGAPGFSSAPCSSVSEVPTGISVYPNSTPASTSLPCSAYLSCSFLPSGGTGYSWWKANINYPTSTAFYIAPFPPIGPDVTGGPGPGGHAYHIPAEAVWVNAPVDTHYSSTYNLTHASCVTSAPGYAGNLATVNVSVPTKNYPSGIMRITGTGGVPPSGYDGEWNFTGTFDSQASLTSASFYVSSCPGTLGVVGTMQYPIVKQFDAAAMYQMDGTAGVAVPLILPNPGPYTTPQTITITTTTTGATICYTTDGSTPTANGAGTCTHGTTYSTGFSLTVPGTVKAIGSKSGLADSGVATNGYTLVGPGVPTGIQGGGSITGGASVTQNDPLPPTNLTATLVLRE